MVKLYIICYNICSLEMGYIMVLSLNFCTDPSILRVILMFKIVIDIIKIIIPIALIVMVMLDISKYVSSFESNSTIFKKVRGRVFAAALVFLIPSFVNTFLTYYGP